MTTAAWPELSVIRKRRSAGCLPLPFPPPPPVRVLEKTSLSEAGDQSPRRSSAELLVTFVWCDPSIAIVKTSQLPVRSLSKAITLPFGAQRGLRSLAVASLVRSAGAPLPLAAATKMSNLPLLVLAAYATLVPSGDHVGRPPSATL